ncbi:fumarylacetoacetate hydrolase family protein [Variovorax sp. UC74_104]|uniref:fumarylacetoacetate hydrolase family protein n=1 Tax=Variovorax sp. UC74_104 TaxID=3374555 RepID=UPI003757F68E
MNSLTSIADSLANALRQQTVTSSASWELTLAGQAYEVQDRLLAALGLEIGGWKVGAPDASGEPHTAPIPKDWILPGGSELAESAPLVEVEVAVRLGVDLDSARDLPSAREFALSLDASCIAMESVATRLSEGVGATQFAKLADLQSHRALVLGPPLPAVAADFDLRQTQARLFVDEQMTVDTVGGNPAQDMWRLLAWLARHCAERGVPLRKGQWVTTGSCTGLTAIRPGQAVRGEIAGLGIVHTVRATEATVPIRSSATPSTNRPLKLPP